MGTVFCNFTSVFCKLFGKTF